jgi:hypothetical protein
MMSYKKNLLCGLLAVLLILMSACTTTPAVTPDLAATIAVNVSVSQTAAIAKTSAARTEIASIPTDTPTLEPTATITLTPTSNKIWLTFNRDTYCRAGELTSFPSVTLITIGQTVEVIGQNTAKDSFYVEDPNHSNSRCWVWGKYATLAGDQAILPVFTSMPTVTPTFTPRPVANFSVSYVDMQNCGGDYYLRFYIKNIGSFVWESVIIDLYDGATKISTSHVNTSFVDSTACAAGLSQSDLATGEESYVAAYNPGQFNYDPTGHNIVATISLCRTDSSGGCDPLTIKFKVK